jgi:hypothetical protein
LGAEVVSIVENFLARILVATSFMVGFAAKAFPRRDINSFAGTAMLGSLSTEYVLI